MNDSLSIMNAWSQHSKLACDVHVLACEQLRLETALPGDMSTYFWNVAVIC
jgi:hypothetical protein